MSILVTSSSSSLRLLRATEIAQRNPIWGSFYMLKLYNIVEKNIHSTNKQINSYSFYLNLGHEIPLDELLNLDQLFERRK